MTRNHKLKRTALTAAAVALAAAGPLAACGDDDAADTTTSAPADDTTTAAPDATGESAVKIDDVWARPGTAGGNTAVYMDITGGDTEDALVGVSVSKETAETAQVHETVTDEGDGHMTDDTKSDDTMAGDDHMTDDTTDGSGDHGSDMMTMREVDSIPVPAGETVKLEPGGYHIMLMNLTEDLVVGDTIEVTLEFDGGATETLTAEVQEV